jgi:hypothetical protein
MASENGADDVLGAVLEQGYLGIERPSTRSFIMTFDLHCKIVEHVLKGRASSASPSPRPGAKAMAVASKTRSIGRKRSPRLPQRTIG